METKSLRSHTKKKELEGQLENACKDDEGLGQKLYELAKIALVNIEIREAPKDSTGGDWNAEENTIYLDNDLEPLDMVDMLVFEGYNALQAGEFSALQHRAYDDRMDPKTYGEEKGKLEAKTELQNLEHLFARKDKNSAISQNGQDHLDAMDRKFQEQEKPPYSEMSPEDRKANEESVIEIFLSSPHGARKAKLPERDALKTKELYFYEQVAQTQNVKGIVSYFNDILPEQHVKTTGFLAALKSVPDSPKPTGGSWAGKFYDIVSQRANAIFALENPVPVFSEDQRQVADEEYKTRNGQWASGLTSALDLLMQG